MTNREERILSVIRKYFFEHGGEKSTYKDFTTWTSSLLEPMRSSHKRKGLIEARGNPDFLFFLINDRKQSLMKFSQSFLSEADLFYLSKKEELFFTQLVQIKKDSKN